MKMPRILIVDDDRNLQKLYQTALGSRGYVIDIAQNGEEALKKIEEEKPDLVILDIMMPNIHGLHVLEILRSTPETKDLKVMILTALDDEGIKKKAISLGADEYIIKSQATITSVMQKIESLLG